MYLALYTALHFCVDLSCIYYLTSTTAVVVPNHETWLLYVVLYNFMAFGFPLVLGILADAKKNNALAAVIGCLCVCAAFLLKHFSLISVLLLGFGNGLFHIGGGREILQGAGARYADSGIFISSGAFGVYLGKTLGQKHLVLHRYFILLLALSILLIFALRYEKRFKNCEKQRDFPGLENPVNPALTAGILALLLLTVFLRSLYGGLTVYSWNDSFQTGLLFTFCIVAGKFSGGLAADRFGILTVSVVSLSLSGVLALFSFQSPVCGILSVLCFNMTMPLGLALLYRLLPKAPGLSFGLLMMALFLGTLPPILGQTESLSTPIVLFGICALSMLLFAVSICFLKKREVRL